ncbi:hypothetical protein PF008_g19513 [Phytophthora fragariae]|uniref:Uncharacterized protein n=1 Tax=Phytophthora fragariae TaxID=53985 RepID=A0A6G0R260_9STRA|nr:hypothetical protein PF003_g27546 [Phytophthora fragariae]KAE9314327.1 hypothetical protein PF008_g19513 [Phytophthora fragariae]
MTAGMTAGAAAGQAEATNRYSCRVTRSAGLEAPPWRLAICEALGLHCGPQCGGCRSSTRIPAWAMRAKLSRRKRSNGHIARPSLDHREARLKSPCGGAAHHLPPPNALH